MKIVIALGGNALLKRGEPLTAETQKKNVGIACQGIATLAKQHQVILTHGNGPQIGLLALQAGALNNELPPCPFDILGAESEGMIGYLLQQQLMNLLPQKKLITLLTQVSVQADDPAFDDPTKFIGPIYSQSQAEQLIERYHWQMALDGTNFRRTIASPRPIKILEIATIRLLVEHDVLVICCGGGGVPVIQQNNQWQGVEAVIDKDLASSLLASELQADRLIILTDVEGVMQDWGSPNASLIRRISAEELTNMSFPKGSMGPKVMAACEFVKKTKKLAQIGPLNNINDLLEEKTGTTIYCS